MSDSQTPPSAPNYPPNRAPLWLFVALAGLAVSNLYALIGLLNADTALYRVLRIGYAALWLAIFAGLFAGLFWQRSRAAVQQWVMPLVTLYAVANLIGAVVAARSDYGRGQLAFQTITTFIALMPVWILALRRGWITDRLFRHGRPSDTKNQPEQSVDHFG